MKYWAQNIPVLTYRKHVDTCDICNDKTTSNKEHKEHQKKKAYLAREEIKRDDNAITFDLQNHHSLPLLTTNKAYYTHQLVIYNKGIHDIKHNQGYSHLWDESIAKRGSREIASVIHHFIRKNWDRCKKPIHSNVHDLLRQ